MAPRRIHPHIPKLKEQLAAGVIGRREFLRVSTLLGLSAGAAYMALSKVTGERLAAKATQPSRGGSLRVAMRVHDISDPHTYAWVDDSNIARQVCEYLTRTGHDNVTRPHLLESWEASDDLRTWTLRVRPDVHWHSGRRFTAEDAAANIHHVLDPETGSSVLGLMKGYMMDDAGLELWDSSAIQVIDSETLELNLKVPQVAVPEHLFHYPLIMADPEADFKIAVGANGTGAFDLVEHVVGIKSVLKARDDYWGEGPYLDRLTFIDMGDDASASVGALASQQVEIINQGDISQLDIVRVIPGAVIHSADTAQTAVARVQVDLPLFEDPRVRMALKLAIDPARVLEIAHRGLGKPGEHHHVCPIHPDYFRLQPMERDVERARALLAEAGVPELALEIACKKDPAWELNAVQAMVEMWREVGITVTINLMPSAQFWDNWDKVPFGFTSWTHRPLGFMVLGLAYRSGVPWNESHYANPTFDELLTQAEGTLDIEERKLLMKELETIMQQDGPITQPLWRSVFSVASGRVQGYSMHPTSYFFGEQVSID